MGPVGTTHDRRGGRKEDRMAGIHPVRLIIGAAISLVTMALMAFAGGAWGASRQLVTVMADVQTLKATDARHDLDLRRLEDVKLDKASHAELVAAVEAFRRQYADDQRQNKELLMKILERR